MVAIRNFQSNPFWHAQLPRFLGDSPDLWIRQKERLLGAETAVEVTVAVVEAPHSADDGHPIKCTLQMIEIDDHGE